MSDGQVSQRRIIPYTTDPTTIDLGEYNKKKIGIILDSSEDEVRLPIDPDSSPTITIGNTEFLLGTTGIYELDTIEVSSIAFSHFPLGCNIIVDYTILEWYKRRIICQT